MDARSQDTPTSIGLLVLRLGIAGYMASHGVGKLDMIRAGQWEQMGDPVGIGPVASLVLVTFAELACALLVVIGLATRLACIPPVIAMGVAAFVAHGGDPWSSGTAAMAFFAGMSKTWASKEPALIFLFAFLGLAFTGAGRFSLDALVGPRLRRWRESRRGAGAPSLEANP